MNKLRIYFSQINWPLIGFILSLLIPSTAVVQKYLGLNGVAAYLVIASLIMYLGYKYVLSKIIQFMTDKRLLWLVVVAFLVLLVLFIILYPIANSGLLGSGSDRDEALNIATSELLKGHYPYYLKTYFGNPITPMPGSLFLAVPFVLIGNSAYQNLFWFFLFLYTLNYLFNNKQHGVSVLFVILALAPCVMLEYVTGGDLLANSIYVFVFIVWAVIIISKNEKSIWKKILIAVLLGLSLSSRSNFILLLPLVFSAYVKNNGWKSAIVYLAISGFTFLLLTVPFYLYDPQGFSPLHTINKLNQFQDILPKAGLIVPLVSGIIGLILSFSQNTKISTLLINCTIVLAIPVLIGIVLQSIMFHTLDFSFAGYGLPFVFFGSTAFFLMLMERKSEIKK